MLLHMQKISLRPSWPPSMRGRYQTVHGHSELCQNPVDFLTYEIDRPISPQPLHITRYEIQECSFLSHRVVQEILPAMHAIFAGKAAIVALKADLFSSSPRQLVPGPKLFRWDCRLGSRPGQWTLSRRSCSGTAAVCATAAAGH